MAFKDWILVEHNHWMAINKPAGLIVERSSFEAETIEALAWKHLQQQYAKPYLGIVHRLDRVTSGVLLLAKRKSALRRLNLQFQEKQVRKTYLAVCTQAPATPSGELVHWLWKDQKNKRAEVYDHPGADRLEVRLSYKHLKNTAVGHLLEIRPGTGKFHQIRAQLAAIGCPIIGDVKYGGAVREDRKILLHAWKLHFNDPQTQVPIEVQAAPVDQAFE